jgi:hypothetical protein
MPSRASSASTGSPASAISSSRSSSPELRPRPLPRRFLAGLRRPRASRDRAALPAALALLLQNAQHHPAERTCALADGSIESRVELSSLEEIARWVLAFGGAARAVAPEALRLKVHQMAAAVARANAARR